jgi:hypothetical protein
MLTGLATYERQAAAIAREVRLLRQDAEPAPTRSAVEMAADLGLALDAWQRDVLTTSARDILLLCSRQAGKSTVAALLALHQAVFEPGSLVLALSPSERQSKRLLRVIRRHYEAFRALAPATTEGQLTLELHNGSEIHALPGKEGTVRGFSEVDLLIIDEAARVADELYASVRPMLAVSGGQLIALSTPFGKRGFFHREWTEGGPDWHRAKVTAFDVPRIPRDWLERERARIGDWWFRQEYGCEFLETDDQLYATDLVLAALSRDVVPLGLPTFAGER